MKTRKAHQRGAALTEAVVVIPAFIILFATMLFIHKTIRAHQRTMADTRNQTWHLAMRGDCGGFTAATALLGMISPAPPTNAGGVVERSAREDVTQALPGTQASVAGPDSYRHHASSRTTLYCDQTPESGDDVGIMRAFKDLIPLAFK